MGRGRTGEGKRRAVEVVITLQGSTVAVAALWAAGCLVLSHRLYADASSRREGEALLRGARLGRTCAHL